MNRVCRHLRGELIERAQIVDDPKRATLGRDNQVLAMNLDIGNRNVWQIQLEWLPMTAVIERNEQAEFSTGVKQPLAVWILSDYSRRPISWYAVLPIGQSRPGIAVIVSAINVRFIVAEQPAVDGVISRAL